MPVRVTAFGCTDPGGVRTNNEDALLVANLDDSTATPDRDAASRFESGLRGVLLAVSDGMGGEQAGEVASAMALDLFRVGLVGGLSNSLSKPAAEQDPVHAIREAILATNEQVYKASREPGKKGMGATLTAVLVRAECAYIIEVGDSRAYLFRNGALRQITRDQSYAQFLVDSGVLKPELAEKFPHKNVILQAIGRSGDVVPEIHRLDFRQGDTLLLCSDGLHGVLDAETLRDRLSAATNPKMAAEGLVQLAKDKGADDNVTAIVATVEGDMLPAARNDERVTLTLEPLLEYEASLRSPGSREETDPAISGPLYKPVGADSIPSPDPAKGGSTAKKAGVRVASRTGRATDASQLRAAERAAGKHAPEKHASGEGIFLLALLVLAILGFIGFLAMK